MRRPIRPLLLGLALTALALPAAAAPKPAVVTQAPTGEMTLGDPKARVEVVEYASLTCPHCARFHAEVFGPFKAKYVDTGKVRFTLKEMLTAPVPLAAAGYLVARCAGKDRYFAVVDDIFDHQAEMFGEGGPMPVLLRAGQVGGLGPDQVRACINDEAKGNALYDRVEKTLREDKIDSTPTVFVGGTLVGKGEIPLAQLEAAIAQARKKLR